MLAVSLIKQILIYGHAEYRAKSYEVNLAPFANVKIAAYSYNS